MIYKKTDKIIDLSTIIMLELTMEEIKDFFNTILETLNVHSENIRKGIASKAHKKVYYGAHTMKGLSSLGVIAIVNICADFIKLTEEVKNISDHILYIQKFEIYKKYYEILMKEIKRFKEYVKNFSEKDIKNPI